MLNVTSFCCIRLKDKGGQQAPSYLVDTGEYELSSGTEVCSPAKVIYLQAVSVWSLRVLNVFVSIYDLASIACYTDGRDSCDSWDRGVLDVYP